MKSEKEVKTYRKQVLKTREATYKRFIKYDGFDDMHAVAEYDAILSTLDWVLGESR